MRYFKHIVISLAVILTGVNHAEEPSLTNMGAYETPSRHAHGTVTYNLGPTGARGWVRGHEGGKLFWGANGKEILISHVDAGSPADGILQTFDVIVGAEGKAFDKDARVCLGEAIFAAEKKDGKLQLTRWRPSTELGTGGGKTEDVVIELPLLDEDTAVLPSKPEHSKVIRERALDYLVNNMHPDCFKMHPCYRDFNALFILAHGRTEHLDIVRRNLRPIIERNPGGEHGPWNWEKGMDAILLSEYFQATGDTQVLPALENLCRWMENSRSYAGGWGHGGPYGGYGHVGHPGLFNAIGLVLARECGIKGYDRVINDAIEFYARGAGLGMMSYGGFSAGLNTKTIYGDNGKSGTAAVLYNVLGDDVNTRAFATSASALAPYNESGHTGHFWSYSWGSIGAAMAPKPYRKFHAETTNWYYTLARTWRGGITAQPWMVYMWSYAPNGPIANTGGNALWYCLPMKSLRILGKEKSVFVQDLNGPLAEARQTFFEKDYTGCLEILGRLKPSPVDKTWVDELQNNVAQARKTIELTKATIKADLEKGDVYRADRRLNALKPILADLKEVGDLESQVALDESQAVWKTGEEYYNAMKWGRCNDYERLYFAPQMVFDAKQREGMETIATGKGYYATSAQTALKKWPADPTYEPVDLVKSDIEFVHENRLFVGKQADAKNGVAFKYFEFDDVPDTPEAVKKLTPVKEGVVQNFDLSPKKRTKNFAFVFRTFLDVAEGQDAKFTTTSDDGSWLYVDGKLVVENGGLHGMESKHGTVSLTKGRRELECVLIQGGGGFGLKLDMANLDGASSRSKMDEEFAVEDPATFEKLRLKVKATGAVTVLLNGEVICRFAKKRKKEMFDAAWKEWETVTLNPAALKLLKKGANTIGVETDIAPLSPGNETLGIQLQGL